VQVGEHSCIICAIRAVVATYAQLDAAVATYAQLEVVVSNLCATRLLVAYDVQLGGA
jgi:hypothetical protein